MVTGKDLVKELQARLPKMKKADVDRAVRKHLALRRADDRHRRRRRARRSPTRWPAARRPPIIYDTAGTPPDVVAEDDLIKRFPVPIEKDHVTVVPVEQMFEK